MHMFIYRASQGDESRKSSISATSACLFFPTLTSSYSIESCPCPLRRRGSSVRCPGNKRLLGSLNCSGLGVVMSNCIVVQWSFVDRECKTVKHFNRSLVSPWCWPLRCSPPTFQLCERQRELNPCPVECHQQHHAFCSWCLFILHSIVGSWFPTIMHMIDQERYRRTKKGFLEEMARRV